MKNTKGTTAFGLMIVVRFSLAYAQGGISLTPYWDKETRIGILKHQYESVNTWQHFMAFEKYQRN